MNTSSQPGFFAIRTTQRRFGPFSIRLQRSYSPIARIRSFYLLIYSPSKTRLGQMEFTIRHSGSTEREPDGHPLGENAAIDWNA